MLLTVFLDTVYVPLRLRGRSQESVRLLRHAIKQFSLWLGRDATLEDFDDLVVARFLLARSSAVAPNSVARERSGIVAMWNLAQARGLVRLRPCVQAEVLPEKTPRALTADELDALVASARLAQGWIGPVRAATFFLALIGIGFYSGERIAAMLAIPKENWRRPWITVPPRSRKGGRQERIYELPPDVADIVDEAAKNDGPFVLWFPASDTALRKRWKVITKRAGLGDEREVQFHVLRKSTASHLAAAGGDATTYLGHSSDKVTRKSYLDPRITGAGKPKIWQMLPHLFSRREPNPPAA
jgi:integrase